MKKATKNKHKRGEASKDIHSGTFHKQTKIESYENINYSFQKSWLLILRCLIQRA